MATFMDVATIVAFWVGIPAWIYTAVQRKKRRKARQAES